MRLVLLLNPIVSQDVCWTQDAYWPGLILGAAAVVWTLYLMSFAVLDRNAGEVWVSIGQLAWLLANWIWMLGELRDHVTPGCAGSLMCFAQRIRV